MIKIDRDVHFGMATVPYNEFHEAWVMPDGKLDDYEAAMTMARRIDWWIRKRYCEMSDDGQG